MGSYAKVMAAALITILITLLCILSPLQVVAGRISAFQSPFIVAAMASKDDANLNA